MPSNPKHAPAGSVRKRREAPEPPAQSRGRSVDQELPPRYDPAEVSEAGFKACFVYVERGPGAGQLVPVSQGVLVIGRSSVSDLRLQHASISRRHAQITRVGDRYYLKDLGSQNGTFVNRARIVAEMEIFPGDEISIGNAMLRLRGKGKNEPATLPAPPRALAEGPDRPSAMVSAVRTSARQPMLRPRLDRVGKLALLVGGVGALVVALSFGTAALLSRKPRQLQAQHQEQAPVEAAPTPEVAVEESSLVVRNQDEIEARMRAAMGAQTAPAAPKVLRASEGPMANAPPGARERPARKPSKIIARYEDGYADEALTLARKAGDRKLAFKLRKFHSLYKSGQRALKRKDGTTAIRRFEAALKLDKQLSEGWGRYGTALRGQLAMLYTFAGDIHSSRGNLPAAKLAYAEALKHEPEYAKSLAGLARIGVTPAGATAARPPKPDPEQKKVRSREIDSAFGD
jgi:tetratricopeptide (TPR) repeat protein